MKKIFLAASGVLYEHLDKDNHHIIGNDRPIAFAHRKLLFRSINRSAQIQELLLQK